MSGVVARYVRRRLAATRSAARVLGVRGGTHRAAIRQGRSLPRRTVTGRSCAGGAGRSLRLAVGLGVPGRAARPPNPPPWGLPGCVVAAPLEGGAAVPRAARAVGGGAGGGGGVRVCQRGPGSPLRAGRRWSAPARAGRVRTMGGGLH
eukprot:1169707-Prymnesium_polylepis.1